MSIKKPFVDVVNFLESHKKDKVSSILEQVKLMCESKKQANTFIKDSNGNIVAIYCWYHKQWEVLKSVPYGSKKNSTTGLNTMCKIGTSNWTKSQTDAKKEKEKVLIGVSNGSIKPANIIKLMDEIELKRNTINKTNMPKGYTNEVDVNKALSIDEDEEVTMEELNTVIKKINKAKK